MNNYIMKGEVKHHLSKIKENITTSGELVQGLFNEFDVDLGLMPTSILRKPIGINSKCYGFMESMLHRNIGSHQYSFDGYGTPIGMMGNPYLNSDVNPWFKLDSEREKYNNYFDFAIFKNPVKILFVKNKKNTRNRKFFLENTLIWILWAEEIF